MSSSQQINATSAQVQTTAEGATIVATLPAISAPVTPLGLSSIPTPSVVTPFTIHVPSAGPRVTFPPSMTQFMNDPANLHAIQGFGASENEGILPGEEVESQPRGPVANRLTIPNDRVQQMEAKLERLEKKVGEKNDRDKPLAGSPFTARVHLTSFPRKAKFQENYNKRKKFTYLSTAGQRESENLTQFLTRWKEEVDKEAYHTAWEFPEAETQLRAKKDAEHGFKPKSVQIKKEEAPGSSRPRHHYDPVIRVVNTEECTSQSPGKSYRKDLEKGSNRTYTGP
ncbi:unnamed protein product [Cuscuta campestris]|uniref:Uncharacterized protein n=1 Tax=Cuscuta campestris TaxID=132261 RepID=A0A484LKR3_9ASTE|nr:unnamed protein product [Cuscuta campestris]